MNIDIRKEFKQWVSECRIHLTMHFIKCLSIITFVNFGLDARYFYKRNNCHIFCGVSVWWNAGICQKDGRCLCWWGWTGPNGVYIDGGPQNNLILADYCTEPCHYTHDYRNPSCGSDSNTTKAPSTKLSTTEETINFTPQITSSSTPLVETTKESTTMEVTATSTTALHTTKATTSTIPTTIETTTSTKEPVITYTTTETTTSTKEPVITYTTTTEVPTTKEVTTTTEAPTFPTPYYTPIID